MFPVYWETPFLLIHLFFYLKIISTENNKFLVLLLENIFKKHLVVSFLEVGQLNTKGMSLRLVSLSLKIGENMLLDLKC